MTGLAREVEKLVQVLQAAQLFTATVVSSTANSVTVLRYTGDANIVCGAAESYILDGPAAGEEVLVAYTGGGFVVLCRVLHP